MLDHQLLTRPIKPRTPDRALAQIMATHLQRRARPGVTWRPVHGGMSVVVDEVEHLLVLRPEALDAAFAQFEAWGAT